MAARRWTRRQWVAFAATVVVLLLVGYVGSYAYFYRRGVAEADAVGLPYFFYAPVAEVFSRNPSRQQEWLGPLYKPVNHLHRSWFGGRAQCSGFTMWLAP